MLAVMGTGKENVVEMDLEENNEPSEASEAQDEASAEVTEEPESEDSAATAGESEETAEQPEPAAELPEELAITDEELIRLVAGLLFASPDALPPARIAKLIEPRRSFPVQRIEEALQKLGENLEAAGLPIIVRTLAGGVQLLTDPEMAVELSRLFASRKVDRMTPAGLETLSVVAYRQPVTKSEIEAIRGVQAGPVLRNLVDRNLIKVTGRADQPGNPLQYGTTKDFLDRFGLGSLSDLPRDPELLRE